MPDTETSTQQITETRRMVYFAAERTLMAWVRTALGLMTLGFVIDRFGLVLSHIAPDARAAGGEPNPFSFWAGSGIVIVGAVMVLVAAVRYWQFATAYQHDRNTRPGHGIRLGVIFTMIIALAGFVVAAFLLSVGE